MERREATPDEVRALANPLRLRILRLCNRQPRTNRELADELGKDPGTVLHHVRVLVDTGFLAAQQVRKGAKGALEKPYLSTGKSWRLSFPHTAVDEPGWYDAGLEAFREELYAAGPDALAGGARFDLYLDDASLAEFNARITQVVEEFIDREDPDGRWYGAFWGLHRMPGRGAPRERPMGGTSDAATGD
ncbi:ArsR/SmtB family transcription factor [Egicoccus sp. AB-alg2]|uniref:ArsR/SmtB family transcription factor n=1 Tax=Egicoccus sp. AB-alg2 TaxID=3242693 RepID=UPI00359D5F29